MSDQPDPEFDGYNPWGDNWWAGSGDSEAPPEDTDLQPINFGTVELAPGVFATITVEPGTIFDPAEIDLSGMQALLGMETEETKLFLIQDLPPNFDFDNPDVRGPFHDRDALLNFLDDTGLDNFGDIYYDAAHDEYYFEITGTE